MKIRLKKGKEKPICQRHHWIYSGAVESPPAFQDGDLADVFSASGEKLGIAMLNKGRSILGHMIAFGDETLEQALTHRIREAALRRRRWFDPAKTNAIRIINAEGDGMPGLIADLYGETLVLQVGNPGIEQLKNEILQILLTEFRPKAVYEKSTSSMRKREGLEETRSFLYGDPVFEVEVVENHLHFAVNLVEGQKTGLFLDQREMRALVRELALNRRVLNCFAYTGGFSIAALAGGATHVNSVEISARCGPCIEKNIALNNLANSHRFIQADVFDFLKTTDWNYDLVILDPPAFAKKRDDQKKAFHAYKDLNAHAMRNMAPGSLLLTCSCSYYIDEPLFQNILFRAAHESGRKVSILGRHRQALDHPISIFHPESAYLKSFLLYIE